MLVSSFVLTLLAPLSLTHAWASAVSAPHTWPATGVAVREPYAAPFRNADLLRRGLLPKRPARLYDPSRLHSAPKARLSSTPIPYSDPGDNFEQSGCWSATANPGSATSITANGDQDAVNKCTGLSADRFTLYYNGGTSYTCYTTGYGIGTQEDCSTTNFAYYASSV